MENNFLPQGYKIPDTKGYMKIKEGENTIRILSSPVVGYEYWTNDVKPIRSKTQFKETPNIRLDKDGNPTKIKHFWAFVVWNYEAGAVQILELTQSTIQSVIKALVDNKKWGDPKNYDITINRIGEGFDTEYSVVPNPCTGLDQEILMQYAAKKINLEALYDGKNPFKENALNDVSFKE